MRIVDLRSTTVNKAIFLFVVSAALHGESGREAWLRYAPVEGPDAVPAVVALVGDTPVMLNAQQELIRGLRGMTGHTLRAEPGPPNENAFLLGRIGDLHLGMTARSEEHTSELQSLAYL